MPQATETKIERSVNAQPDALVIDTPIGPLLIEATPTALVGVSFAPVPGAQSAKRPRRRPARAGGSEPLAAAALQLGEYFDGDRREFDLPLDLTGLSGFRRDVLLRTARIPFGDRLSYGELAAAAGRPGAARAVGSAQGANPLAIVIPCHRVVRSDGAVGDYAGGSEAKRWLLEHERSL